MKRRIIIIGFVLSICACKPIYQVMEIDSNEVIKSDSTFSYSNDDLIINYNFWSENGIISINIYNKSENPIYIDWNRSHLIFNELSMEYWNEAEDTQLITEVSQSTFLSGNNAFLKKSVNLSSSISPKKIIHLPPQSYIHIAKYLISTSPYWTCDYNLKYKKSKIVNTKKFTSKNSPIVFRNYLTYSSNEEFDSLKIIDNDFYVNTMHFMKEKFFLGKEKTINSCDLSGHFNKVRIRERVYEKPNRYYYTLKRKK
jgi:hypothetical protein